MNASRSIDWVQVRTLFSAGVRMDFRGYRSSSKMSPVLKTIILNTIVGGSMAAGLIRNTSPFLYSVLVFGYSMLMMALAALYEISNTPDVADILSFRPVSPATILAARTANLLFFTVLIGLALCFIPAWVGLALPNTHWNYPIVFLFVSVIANLFASLLVAGLYPFLETRLSTERLKDAMVYVQIGATFIIFLLLQLYSRVSFVLPYPDAASSPLWFCFLPSVWFASGLSMISAPKAGTDLFLSLFGLISTLLFGCAAFRGMSRRFDTAVEFSSRSEKRYGRADRSALLENRINDREVRAGYALVSNMIRQDRSVKMNVYPLMGIPLAFIFLLLLEKGTPDPFGTNGNGMWGPLPSAMVFIIFFLMIALLFSLQSIRDWEAAWIFHQSPIQSPGKFYRGMCVYIIVRILLPFFTVIGMLFWIKIPFIHAIQYALSLFLFSLMAFSASLFFVRNYPFSKKIERGMRTRRFGYMAMAIPCVVVFFMVQRLLQFDNRLWWAAQAGLLVLALILLRISEKRLDAVLIKKECNV
jgi:ABC-2 type transport system permease protein